MCSSDLSATRMGPEEIGNKARAAGATLPEFVPDMDVQHKLMVTVAPGGFLLRTR